MADLPAPEDRSARVWFRLLFPDQGAFGPGKAELLEAIDSTGSLTRACGVLGMSYRRGWDLVEELNRLCPQPVVETERGGGNGGGSRLTDAGRAMLEIYRGAERDIAAAAKPWLDRVTELGRTSC